MEYHGKFGNTIGQIQQIDIMIIIDICYTSCHLKTHTVAHTNPGLKGLMQCIQYMPSHPNKPIFDPSNYYDG